LAVKHIKNTLYFTSPCIFECFIQ